jgi:hypothetical protein
MDKGKNSENMIGQREEVDRSEYSVNGMSQD